MVARRRPDRVRPRQRLPARHRGAGRRLGRGARAGRRRSGQPRSGVLAGREVGLLRVGGRRAAGTVARVTGNAGARARYALRRRRRAADQAPAAGARFRQPHCLPQQAEHLRFDRAAEYAHRDDHHAGRGPHHRAGGPGAVAGRRVPRLHLALRRRLGVADAGVVGARHLGAADPQRRTAAQPGVQSRRAVDLAGDAHRAQTRQRQRRAGGAGRYRKPRLGCSDRARRRPLGTAAPPRCA